MERLTNPIDEAVTMLALPIDRFELMRDGRLRSVSVGRRRLIPASSLRELVGEPEHQLVG